LGDLKKIITYVLVLASSFFVASCSYNSNNIANATSGLTGADKGAGFNVAYAITRDTTFVLNTDTVDILFPPGEIKGQILILPGWNYSRKKCCNESSFCKKALEKGYVLILPEMGKSIYASTVYPETRKDWIKYPELKWVTDTLILYLQNQAGIFKPTQHNYIFGISTGGRGVALIVEHVGKLFKAGAALSGDYDQTQLPNDNLMKGFYGSYTDFKQRWEGEDNALLNASKVAVPLYLGHGLDDKIVPVEQTHLFYKELKRVNEKLSHVLHLAEQHGHNYAYWDSETGAVLDFFEKY
jgi:dienelactone hydrolase